VEGLFEYKGLPQENITLIVVDENGFPMDTIITDKDGKFTYRKSLNDENFSIKPLMNSENLLVENVEIFATDKSGEKLSSLIVNTNQNVENTTETVAAKVPELDQLSTNIQVAKDKTIVKPGADELASKSNVDESSINKKPKTNATTTPEEPMVKSSGKTIYFDFNERTLTADDKAILDQIITSLRSNPKSSVTMIGFTDNIGSVEVNVRVASARARAARAYLTENGISKSRITIYGYGEVMFKGDNRTEKGRALNRRVEIELN
jgi:outer membrane protein OmpA-like peptidoglycan-associated protein